MLGYGIAGYLQSFHGDADRPTSGYNLPPGCFERDLPGHGETHYKECLCHEDNDDYSDGDECTCREMDAQAKEDAEEQAFELARERE